MEPLWRSLEYPIDSLGIILKAPPRDFLLQTLCHILGLTHVQKPLGGGPSGFWPWVWPRMRQRVCQKKILRGSLQYTPEAVYCILKGPPERLHSPQYLQGFSTDYISFCIPNKSSQANKQTTLKILPMLQGADFMVRSISCRACLLW